MKFRNAVPVSGSCNKCGRSFETPADAPTDAMTDEGKVTRDFYKAFEQHKCEADAR